MRVRVRVRVLSQHSPQVRVRVQVRVRDLERALTVGVVMHIVTPAKPGGCTTTEPRGPRPHSVRSRVTRTLSPYSPGRTSTTPSWAAALRAGRGLEGGVDRGRVVGHEHGALEQPEVLERRPAAKAELPGDVVEHVGGKGGGSHGLRSGGVDGGHALTRGGRDGQELGRLRERCIAPSVCQNSAPRNENEISPLLVLDSTNETTPSPIACRDGHPAGATP